MYKFEPSVKAVWPKIGTFPIWWTSVSKAQLGLAEPKIAKQSSSHHLGHSSCSMWLANQLSHGSASLVTTSVLI